MNYDYIYYKNVWFIYYFFFKLFYSKKKMYLKENKYK